MADSTLCAPNNKKLFFRKIVTLTCLAKFLKKKRDFCLVLQTFPCCSSPSSQGQSLQQMVLSLICFLFSLTVLLLTPFFLLMCFSTSPCASLCSILYPKSTHGLAEIAHCEEESCYEKPVSTKETEESCSLLK